MTAAADAPEEYPIALNCLPPPRPFDRVTALQWLECEAKPLFGALHYALRSARDEATRNHLSVLYFDALCLLQAAAEVVVNGKPDRPIHLDTHEPDWPDNTRNLVVAVSSALADRTEPSDPDTPPAGWNKLAEILRQRFALEEAEDGVRGERARKLGYPMGWPPPSGEDADNAA